jgi:ligand-binding sensor domain-containing protein
MISPDQGLLMTTVQELPGVSANALTLDEDGQLWVGTLAGLVQIDTASALILQRVGNLPGTIVQSLTTGPDGKLWVGTPSSLLVIDPNNPFAEPRSVTPLRGRSVTAVRFALDGSVWVGTESGLLKIRAETGAVLGELSNLPSDYILSLSPDVGNKLWVGTTEGLAWVSLSTGQVRPHLAFVKNPPETF